MSTTPQQHEEYRVEDITHIHAAYRTLKPATQQLMDDLGFIAGHLKQPHAKVFLFEGVMRRLRYIQCGVDSIFDVFPPERRHRLNSDEQDKVALLFQSCLINVYGLLDNIAWVCALEGGYTGSPHNVGLYKKDIEQFLPQQLLTYSRDDTDGSFKRWYETYARTYRDSIAHRIPAYIPPFRVTPQEAEQYNELGKAIWQAINDQAFEECERLTEEQEKIGSITACVAISLHGDGVNKLSSVRMHVQLICDTQTVQKVLGYFLQGMREMYSLPPSPLRNH